MARLWYMSLSIGFFVFVCLLGHLAETARQKHACEARTAPNNYCTKKCTRNRDCRGKNKKKKKRCLCDADCGLSCVLRGKGCDRSPPELTKNGAMLVKGLPYNPKSKFDFGEVITYKCDKGYTLSGPSSVRCSAIGRWKPWDQGIPSCSKQCPELSAPQNGRIAYQKQQVGGSVSFRCFPGYELVGDATLTCLKNLTWSSTSPSCQVLFCKVPILPENARIESNRRNDYQYGDRLQLNCMPGYFMRGGNIIECIGKVFRFVGRAMKCYPKSCGFPGAILNGKREGNIFTVGKVVQYSCNPGYKLKGSGYRVCQANQRWTGTLTYCDAISCGDPPFLMNGRYNAFGTSFRDTQEVKCDKGFKPSDSDTIKCQADGKWSHTVSCQLVTCPLKELQVTNGVYSGSDAGYSCTVQYNCRVKFFCNPGYDRRGKKHVVCTENGVWSDKTPSCEAKNCGMPPLMSAGYIYGRDYTFNNTVRYLCYSGYDLIGDPETRCNEFGVWDTPPPTCQPKSCGYPGIPENGFKIGWEYTYPNTVDYYCQKGYELKGSTSRACSQEGTWTDQVPSCEIHRCEDPPKLEHGHVTGQLYTYNESLSFFCEKGYQLEGPQVITCTERGWNKIWPSCNIISCGSPAIANGKVVSNTVYGTSIQVQCELGYELEDSVDDLKNITCQANKSWTRIPVCKAVSCGVPAGLSDTNAILFGQQHTFKYSEILEFKCNKGQTLEWKSIACLENGKWSNKVPYCTDITCPPPRLQLGTETLTNDVIKVGTIVRYECLEGYRLDGESTSECLITGKWNTTGQKCDVVRCPNPINMPDGNLLYAGSILYGRKVRFSCKLGYKLVGMEAVTCLANGQWNGDFPKCVESCDEPLRMDSGPIRSDQVTFENRYKINDDQSSVTSWCGSSKSTMTVNFESLRRVTGIMVQGISSIGLVTKKFSLHYISPVDGVALISYGEITNNANNASEVVTHLLTPEITTSILKITLPNFNCGRFDFLGCKVSVSKKGYCDPTGTVEHGQVVQKFYRNGDTLKYTCDSGFYANSIMVPKCNRGDFYGKVVCEQDKRYKGCYKPDELTMAKTIMKNNSPSVCLGFCKEAKYSFAMLTDTNCYCAKKMETKYRVPEKLCSLVCPGEKTMVCGGKRVASVYVPER